MALNTTARVLRQAPSTLQQSINLNQKRSWSARTIPSLTPTQSPELDQLLNRFRDELFIPHSLKVQQRNLIYRPRLASKLTGHPIVVPIGPKEEPYQLRPIDIWKVPGKKDSLRVIALMHETKDWSNLVNFLRGLHKAGLSFQPRHWEWLVRKAGGSNGLGALVMAAQQSHTTGFTLNNVSLVERLFFELHLAGQRIEFTGEGIAKIYGLANSFTLLMHNPHHAVSDLDNDPKRSTLVIGTLLELSAARALSDYGSNVDKVEYEAVEKKVEYQARRLLASLKRQNLSQVGEDWVSNDKLLQRLVPCYNGLKLALQVDVIARNKQFAAALKTRTNELGMFIGDLKKGVHRPTIGLVQAQLLHQN
ncbi:uncharacterized protein DSM5745_10540 [Aspergillus mulundensis]|uniref:Uncharacterized protein n=1 Tax=Aspergillus mulundensis TaxID=1810919 RepID=A0A3D8QJH6_9EURO|nr:Uncharacterized protein DSM5745_10540 [Aspergillus mulundensis]RDW61868.1 Uncharacterized protein DSM5745_10540 [Aspergillus mulundensis]